MFYKFGIVLLALAQGVLCATQMVYQCGPGLYDPKCTSKDICCYREGLGGGLGN
ncbi:hypothetical protein K438DRAFT_1965158 [Mycena galopus ATCC 62051]|nr:hypothetical protein K438DRAFT_1965158 [Mycena galopus ATCC 62051]